MPPQRAGGSDSVEACQRSCGREAAGKIESCRKTNWCARSGIEAEEKRAKDACVNVHFPMQKVEKISPRISSASAAPTTSPTASRASRKGTAISSGSTPVPEFFCSLAQAGLGTLKASLMPRVDCGQHRSVSGAISAGFGHDQIYEMVNSLAGPAGNGHRLHSAGAVSRLCGDREDRLCLTPEFRARSLRVSVFA